jgi:hypothetical protein
MRLQLVYQERGGGERSVAQSNRAVPP